MRAYSYIYSVRDIYTGEIIVKGRSDECSAAIGVPRSRLTEVGKLTMDGSPRILKHRYTVTREEDTTYVHPSSNYYEVYLNNTGELVCAGTAAECTEALGLKDIMRFKRMIQDCNAGRVYKWDIFTGIPYKEVSPDLTRVPSINNSARERINHHKKTRKSKSPNYNSLWYSIYLKKTGELLCSGTSAECAKALGITNIQNFYVLTCNVRKGTNKKYEIHTKPYPKNNQEAST